MGREGGGGGTPPHQQCHAWRVMAHSAPELWSYVSLCIQLDETYLLELF
jgi:hypothetical protein